MEKKVYLRIPFKEELHYRQAWMKDPKTMLYNAGYDIDLKGYDKKTGIIIKTDEEMKQWYHNWIHKEPNRYFAYIFDKELEIPIGEIYYYYQENIGQYGMGILINSKYRGNGYGYSALLELEKIVFEKNNISVLSNRIPLDRVNAIKLFEKAGFIRMGIIKKEKRFDQLVDVLQLVLTKEKYFNDKDRSGNKI